MKEYVIMRNRYYVQKGKLVSTFTLTRDLTHAIKFNHLQETVEYVENDMHLNIKNVSIHMIETKITETILVVDYKGDFVDIGTVFACDLCNEWHPRNQANGYRHDLDSDLNVYCDKCYEKINDKYPTTIAARKGVLE